MRAIWRCRNDLIFNKIKVNSVLHVIFRGTYWFCFWAQLQREEHAKNTFSNLSRLIEIVALNLVKGGGKHVYRLQQFGVSLVTGVLFSFFQLLQTLFFFGSVCLIIEAGLVILYLKKCTDRSYSAYWLARVSLYARLCIVVVLLALQPTCTSCTCMFEICFSKETCMFEICCLFTLL